MVPAPDPSESSDVSEDSNRIPNGVDLGNYDKNTKIIKNQIIIMLAVLHEWRGPSPRLSLLDNTAPKKHRDGGEPSATSCPI